MTPIQHSEAVDLIDRLTDLPVEEIEEIDDAELGQWLYELGYDWDASAGLFGAWIEARDEKLEDEAVAAEAAALNQIASDNEQIAALKRDLEAQRTKTTEASFERDAVQKQLDATIEKYTAAMQELIRERDDLRRQLSSKQQ